METRHTKKLLKTNNFVKKMASVNSFKFLSNRLEKNFRFSLKIVFWWTQLYSNKYSFQSINLHFAVDKLLCGKKFEYLNIMKEIFELSTNFLPVSYDMGR